MRSLSTRFAISLIIISACMVPMAASAQETPAQSNAETIFGAVVTAVQFPFVVAVDSLTDIFVQIGVGEMGQQVQVATVAIANDTARSAASAKSALFCPRAFGQLKKGKEANTEKVIELQKFIASYYGLPEALIVTGKFDPITRGFVADLQEKNALEGVGDVGEKTVALLGRLCGTATSTESAMLPPKPERNASSTPSSTTTLKVRTEAKGSPMCMLKASESKVAAGRPVTLTWVSKNAMYSLGPEGVKEDIQGSKTFVISDPTTFRKTVVGSDGVSATCEMTVEIKEAGDTAVPAVQLVYTPPTPPLASAGANNMLASVGAAALFPFARVTEALTRVFVAAGIGQENSASVVLTSEYISSQ